MSNITHHSTSPSSRFPCLIHNVIQLRPWSYSLAFLIQAIAALGWSPAPVSAIPMQQEVASPAVTAVGNDSGVKVLGIDDYARWRRVITPTISNDGAWAAFGYRKNNAFNPDPVLHVKSLRDDVEIEILEASDPRFSDNSRWIAFFVDLPFDETEKLRIAAQPSPRKVRLLDLTTGVEHTWNNAHSFRFSSGSGFFALKKTLSSEQQGSDTHQGANLILRNLTTGTDLLIGSVGEHAFNDRDRSDHASGTLRLDDGTEPAPADMLAYTVDAADQAGNGLYVLDLSSGVNRALDNDARVYSRLTWSGDGSALAVLKGKRSEGYAERANLLIAATGLHAGTAGADTQHELDPASTENFPENMVISERGDMTWSANSSHLFFGIKDQTEIPEKPEYADRIANVDVWHWQDERIQALQMAQSERDRDFTYRAVFLAATGSFVRLTDETMKDITISRDGRWGIGRDERAYISDWKEPQADYYKVDAASGERTQMLSAQKITLGLTPDGGSYLYWREGHLWRYELDGDKTHNLTASAPLSFVNTEHDYPDTPPPYGIAGFSKDGAAVLLNHRYDLWLQPLDGSTATNLTGGVGSEREIRFRYVATDPDARTIDISSPLLLSAYGHWTKQAGFYRLFDGELEELVIGNRRFGPVLRARNSDVFLYTRETFREFPDLWVSDGTFATPSRVSVANPWQSEYRWGRRILFDFFNNDGQRLQGTLAIPDGIEIDSNGKPQQSLPMIVNFYEKNSQNLHRHLAASYLTGFGGLSIEALGKGYLLMQADIHFRTGNTHADMLECVEAATQKVIEMGYADPENIGLNGHSFSGQGSAYIAGRSDLFAAVAAGAAATNLEADFNHFWGWTPTNKFGTGNNAHRYDYWGQGRLGTNPYDNPELYRRESATTYARTIDTPLLMMHGDADGVVGVMEALQLYNGMRFNGNNIIVLTYPGEGHGLRNLANRRDLTIRLLQFWDHHLMGKPAPGWMVDGIPFQEKTYGAWDRGRGR